VDGTNDVKTIKDFRW